MGEEPTPSPAIAHREWIDTLGIQDPPDHSGGHSCTVHADDGAQCQRELNHEGAHDFAQQSGNPVDGGQKWQHWIHLVHAARAILLDQPVTPERPYRTGIINGPDDTRKLAQLVGLLGLIPADQHPDGSVTIREP